MPKKLFAVYLGGRAPKGNIELHDVVFAVADSIEGTYEQLMASWFGDLKGLHLDSWMEVTVVDGHKIHVSEMINTPGSISVSAPKSLYFVNLGAYMAGQFGEVHANTLVIAKDAVEAKRRAKISLLQNWPGPVHTDDVYEVDDCLELRVLEGHQITVEETSEATQCNPTNGYHLIPKSYVEEYARRKKRAV